MTKVEEILEREFCTTRMVRWKCRACGRVKFRVRLDVKKDCVRCECLRADYLWDTVEYPLGCFFVRDEVPVGV